MKTLEVALINFGINLMLTWSESYVITNSTGEGTFATTGTVYSSSSSANSRKYKTIVTIEIETKRTINLRKYQSKVSAQAQNQYLSNKSD